MVKKTILNLLRPILIRQATNHLKKDDVKKVLQRNLATKLKKASTTNIGKNLGITASTTIDEVPLTGYEYYFPFYKNPHEGDFMYPLKDYVRSMTSGTMSKPKTYLTPMSGLRQHIRKTGMSLIFMSTFDGEKYLFKFGDTFYINIPGGSFISSIVSNDMSKNQSGLIRLVPENRDKMTFQEKVDYFIEHCDEIDIAQMNVTTLLDDIQPKINKKLNLKAFLTLDASAYALKDRVKEFVGTYPKTPYGSTETITSALPSIEYPGGFFFDWRVIFTEFIEEEDALTQIPTRVDDPPQIFKPWELEVGKRYQLVITMLYTDLIRNVTSDLLECVSTEDKILGVKTPILRFHSRADRIIALHNFTRISEQELIMVLEKTGVPFVDFTARREIEDTKEYLTMYIEFNQDVDIEEVTQKIHSSLLDIDKDYRDLNRMMEFFPLRIKELPRNSFKRFLEKKEGMSRIARVDMREDRLKLLLGSN